MPKRNPARQVIKSTERSLAEGNIETREFLAAKKWMRSRTAPLWGTKFQNTPPRVRLGPAPSAEKCAENGKTAAARGENLAAALASALRSAQIVQKIIGRSIAVRGSHGGSGRRTFRREHSAFALFHEPSGEQGSSSLVHPLIEHGTNFFAQVGSEIEARDFVALESVARSGEKKLPGGWVRYLATVPS